jgi:hypothetical protein
MGLFSIGEIGYILHLCIMEKLHIMNILTRNHPGGNFPHGKGVEGIGEETSLASHMRYP